MPTYCFRRNGATMYRGCSNMRMPSLIAWLGAVSIHDTQRWYSAFIYGAVTDVAAVYVPRSHGAAQKHRYWPPGGTSPAPPRHLLHLTALGGGPAIPAPLSGALRRSARDLGIADATMAPCRYEYTTLPLPYLLSSAPSRFREAGNSPPAGVVRGRVVRVSLVTMRNNELVTIGTLMGIFLCSHHI